MTPNIDSLVMKLAKGSSNIAAALIVDSVSCEDKLIVFLPIRYVLYETVAMGLLIY